MSSAGNIVCTRLLKTNKEWTETESKNPTMSRRNKNSNAIFPFLKKVACVCKRNLDGFDLFRSQSCFHMLHREILSSTFTLNSRVIPSDSTKPWVQISEHLAHPSQGTFFYSFWECWPGGKKDNSTPSFPWRRHYWFTRQHQLFLSQVSSLNNNHQIFFPEPTFVGWEGEAWADFVGTTPGLIALRVPQEFSWCQILQLFCPES